MERISLEHQLGIYIDNISEDQRFANLEGLGDLACVMVETKKTSFTSSCLSTFEASFDFACCHRYCREIFLCDENCEDYLTQPNGYKFFECLYGLLY